MSTELSSWAEAIYRQKYAGEDRDWEDTAKRVVDNVMRPHMPWLADEMTQYIVDRKFIPAGRYLYSAGKQLNQFNNCFLARAEDSREGWAELLKKACQVLMTGGGFGVVYSDVRPRGSIISTTGAESSGPIALMEMINEIGRHVQAGGSRRSALIALLHWNHKDVFEFIKLKDWSDDVRRLKQADFNFPATMDGTNISIILDTAFFDAYNDVANEDYDLAHNVYDAVVQNMLKTGEPGFSVDAWHNEGENLRNPCGEITSADDSDVCNLGSLNLAKINSIEEMQRVTKVATAFLLCGTLSSSLPYEKVYQTRQKNRRLGLGLMGVHHWLAVRGKSYAPDAELQLWLEEYAKSGTYANKFADALSVSRPVKTRAIAPAGSIGIIGETTTGIEPIFSVAYMRRFRTGTNGEWGYQYVVDATARRVIDEGADAGTLEDAYTLAEDPGRRLEMQAWLQSYVDHGISSTLNLPAHDEQSFTPTEFGHVLMKYLPKLRGVTVYPDGARGGQPITRVPFAEADGFEGYTYTEDFGNTQSCVNGACGT